MPEEFRRHEAMSAYGWTIDEYEAAPALIVDWLFAIEGAKATVQEEKQAAGR